MVIFQNQKKPKGNKNTWQINQFGQVWEIPLFFWCKPTEKNRGQELLVAWQDFTRASHRQQLVESRMHNVAELREF